MLKLDKEKNREFEKISQDKYVLSSEQGQMTKYRLSEELPKIKIVLIVKIIFGELTNLFCKTYRLRKIRTKWPSEVLGDEVLSG